MVDLNFTERVVNNTLTDCTILDVSTFHKPDEPANNEYLCLFGIQTTNNKKQLQYSQKQFLINNSRETQYTLNNFTNLITIGHKKPINTESKIIPYIVKSFPKFGLYFWVNTTGGNSSGAKTIQFFVGDNYIENRKEVRTTQ